MSYYVNPRDLARFEKLQIERIKEIADTFRPEDSNYCTYFEVGLLHEQTGQFKLKIKTEQELLKLIPVFNDAIAHMPMHVFFRPISASIILVDDLSWDSLQMMIADGLDPCCVVETSPDNYQAWVRLTYEMIDKELATRASKYLAETYHGDRGCCHYRHLGRLVGYPNLKPQYEKNGCFPFTKLMWAKPATVAKKGIHLLNELTNSIAAHDTASSTSSDIEHRWEKLCRLRIRSSKERVRCLNEAKSLYESFIAHKESNKINWHTQRSEIDFAVACKLVGFGFSFQSIRDAIVHYSPNIEERKKGHLDDYVKRTIINVALKAATSTV